MQSFLAKCAAVSIVAGGFTLTGDLGRLADRGRRLLEAHSVPSEQPVEQSSSLLSGSTPGPAPEIAAVAPSNASPPAREQAKPAQASSPERSWLLPGEPSFDAPVGRSVAVPAPSSSGPLAIDLRQLTAGNRLLVWVRRTGPSDRTMPVDLIALDVIDPRSCEALEHRHAALTHGRNAATVHAPPRRVVVEVDASGRISTGSPLRLTPLHGVNGLGNAETVGTVLALDAPGR